MAICKRVLYTGRVQGVGFRYTVQRLASRLPVAGYVKNLGSGQVELVAEGEADQVQALLEQVAERMAGYIQDTDVRDEPSSGLIGFEIRH